MNEVSDGQDAPYHTHDAEAGLSYLYMPA